MLESHSVILLIQIPITTARVIVAGCLLIFAMALITGASVLPQVVTACFHTIGEARIQSCLPEIERATQVRIAVVIPATVTIVVVAIPVVVPVLIRVRMKYSVLIVVTILVSGRMVVSVLVVPATLARLLFTLTLILSLPWILCLGCRARHHANA